MTQFIKGRNRAFAQLLTPINGSAVNAPLVAGQGARLTQVLTASGDKVRAHIIERDETGAVIKCELVDITNNVSDILTITRAVEDTRVSDVTNTYASTPQSFSENAIIEEVITAEVISEMQDEINALRVYADGEFATKEEVAEGDLVHAASSAGTDTYVVPIDNIDAYKDGITFSFLADVPNSGLAYVRVDGSAGLLAVLEIKKNHDVSLATGDIEAGQIVEGKVNLSEGTFQMSSHIATVVDLSGYTSRTKQMTANGSIDTKDSVYVTGNDIVKTFLPDEISAPTTIATAPTTYKGTKSLPLSTTGKWLHISGGVAESGLNATLVAQVRTINAGETDCTNGSETTIFATNSVFAYDVCEIATDKFLFIFQAYTTVAVGIKCIVVTVSGDTITVGATTTIETTGSVPSLQVACAKADNNKGIIFYNRDSDGWLYTQVLTVSGTTITTNTALLVKNLACIPWAVQLNTDSICVFYQPYSAQTTLYGRKISISGTTPTLDTENTIHTIGGSPNRMRLAVRKLSDTKLIVAYNDQSVTDDCVFHINISGSTLTKSSTIVIGTTRTNEYFGIYAVCPKIALVSCIQAGGSGTNTKIFLINTSGTAPVEITNETCSHTTYGNFLGNSIVKIKPWVYILEIGASIANGNFIIKLTPPTATRFGVAESTIADTGVGSITLRYQLAVLSGLVAGSQYYIDDNGQPTLNTSLVAPLLGCAINTTQLLLS